MGRVNLTLDDVTLRRLSEHAERLGLQRAAAARRLILERLSELEHEERQRRLAADYRAQRDDLGALDDAAQLDLMGDDDD